MHWFLGASLRRGTEAEDADLPDERIPADDTSTASECLACGGTIPPGADSCPACGWSYR